jgi:protein-tyrosine phosphatase
VLDLHSHILPGLDDGARTPAEALAIARASAAQGVTAIAATPHVRDDYPTTPAQMEHGVAALRRELEREGVPVELLPGGELDLAVAAALDEEQLRRFSLAGSGRYLLLECPYHGWPRTLLPTVESLLALGLVPVLAHPERNAEVQARLERLAPLVELGALVQITAASLDGRLGRASRTAGLELARRGLAHLLASDAHSPDLRAAGLAAAAAALEDDGLSRYLTEEAPAAVVAGDPVPAPPRRARRRIFGRARG